MKFRILVFAVIVVLLVSSYVTIIPSLELCSEKALMKSLLLVGHEGSFSFVTLRMGDTLAVVAKVDDVSNAYLLTVQDDAGEVFSKSGEINGSSVEVDVPLYPPSFEAGKSYVVFFHVYAFNYPLLGVVMSDRGMVGFAVEDSETRLSFEVGYDGVFRCLGLCANLTNVDGCPLVDESVSFFMRPVNGKRRLTDGWIPIGSARTNGSGIAFSSVAFGVPDGNYLFRAYHEGDENFGESENVTEIEISSNATGGFGFGCEFSFGEAFSFGHVGDLTISVSSDEPYALLRMNATAQYVVDEPLPGPYIGMFFFCDHLGDPENGTGFVGGSCNPSVTGGPPYSYTTSLEWIPEVVGHHELIVGVVNGSIYDIISGMRGVGLRVLEEVDLEVQRCPSNLVVHYQHAVFDAAFPFSVGFSMPRAYSAISTDFCAVETLAPKFTYNGADYVVDSGVESAEAKLFLNDTLKADLPTDENGLATLPVPLTFSDRLTANVTVVVGHGFCQEQRITRVVTFTNVSVDDSPGEVNDLFGFNYTMGTLDQGESVYAGAEMPVDVKVSLLDLPVWHVPVSVLAAKFGARCCTDGSGWMWMPDLPGPVLDYVRVTNVFCDLEAPAAADVNDDGQVNLYDAVIVSGAYGSEFGDESWNPIADVNCDGAVDLYDIVKVLAAYGEKVTYEEIDDFSIVNVSFDNGQQVCLDSQGCVEFPLDANCFNLSVEGQLVGAVVELFSVDFSATCLTNNVGGAEVTWQPAETGKFLFQVKLPSDFDLFVSDVCDTEICTSVNLVDYYVVEKRPIDLSVDYVPEEPTLDDEVTMIANVFDLGLGEPGEGLPMGFGILGLTYPDAEEIRIILGINYTDSSGVATISFVPRDYKDEYNLFPRFYVIVGCFETSCTLYSEAYVLLDTRYPTRLELLDEEVIHAGVGDQLYLDFRLVRADNGEPVEGKPINVYMNGTWQNCTGTDENGICTFNVTVGEGMCFFRAWFHWSEECVGGEYFDVDYQDSNNVTFVIFAEAEPIFIFFDVQPNELTLGSPMTLSATVLDAMSNQPKSNCHVWFYWCAENGTCGTVGSDLTDAEGVASVSWPYPDDGGVYVFWARVHDKQQIISSPVMLTVGEATTLSMSVEPDEGFDYNFSGRLLCDGDPVAQEPMEVKVNGTSLGYVETGSDGRFSFLVTLPPVNYNPTGYQIELVYHGSNSLNLRGLAKTPDDTEYAVCTTLQYFTYKPASNSTWLTVEPQSTEVTTSTKTPEEMQQEAEDSGWLSTSHEWSWWYPWYRLHFKFTMNNAEIDVGFNPVLPGGETTEYSGLESAFPQLTAEPGLTPEEIAQIAQEAVVEAAIGTLTASVAAIAVVNIRILPSTALALTVYISGLSLMIGYAWSLYSSGAQIKAKAFLVGLVVDLWGVALATFMSVRGALLTEMIVTIVASAFSSLFDVSALQVAVMSAIAALFTSVCVGIATLILVPEPSSITFKLVFPWFSLLFAAIALNIVGLWS